MIKLFNIPNQIINTECFSSMLHDKNVSQLEKEISGFVGAKYGLALNSATSAIFLSLLNLNTTVTIPSIIPPVVANAILTSGNKLKFNDNTEWVGHSYELYSSENFKIIDSAQQIEEGQFTKSCNPQDLMIFSFYPTKPISGCDGGMIVSDDYDKISHIRTMSLNGMTFSQDNWNRKIKNIGYKMYMNSIQADIISKNFKEYSNKIEKLDAIREFYNEKFNMQQTSRHLYRINVKDNLKFMHYMGDNGVSCGIHYDALHMNPIYKNQNINLPKSELDAKTKISIPYHEKLTLIDLQKITELINNYDEHI
ncbi:DegT/DnrJ/EryC1/StrS aminotransferase family protein [archaeon]|jgi:perosamine synthetase|nr:DegT/DnrJ/EryC1/StrS aminotransferase family protein [archaeon]